MNILLKRTILSLATLSLLSACNVLKQPVRQAQPSTPCVCPEPAASNTSPTAPESAATPVKQPAAVAARFDELPAWTQANHKEFLSAFVQQCSGKFELGRNKTDAGALQKACLAAQVFNQTETNRTPQAARQYLETQFDVWQLQKEDGSKDGLLTGYFEPMLRGSRQKGGAYDTPLYGVPKDLITVELGSLFPELEGKRVRGRLEGNKLVPYYDRRTWEKVASNRESPLVWVEGALDAFSLQIQGSGRIELNDGQIIRLSYADQNGHPYKAIGKVLIQRGELTAEQANMPGITDWAARNPSRLQDLLNENPSVVFFTENKKLNPNEGPVGALGLPLTPELSLAVDRKRIAYGSMIWVETTHPSTGQSIRKGMLAQDTGGAISGRVRGDFYWGSGRQAGQWAGLMRQPLKMWLLWPKGVPLPKMD